MRLAAAERIRSPSNPDIPAQELYLQPNLRQVQPVASTEPPHFRLRQRNFDHYAQMPPESAAGAIPSQVYLL